MEVYNIEAGVSRPYLPLNIRNQVDVTLRVDAPKGGPESELVPVHSVLLLDNSGSMHGEPLEKAKNATERLIESMTPNDTICVISFNNNIKTVIPSSSIASKERKIMKKIHKIRANNTTKMFTAIKTASEMLADNPDPSLLPRVIILSDGVPTDVQDPGKYKKYVSDVRNTGVIFSTIGIGASDDRILRAISDSGGGSWSNVWDLDDMDSAFINDLNRARAGVPFMVYLYPKPGVAILGLNLYLPRAQTIDVLPGQKPGTFYAMLPALAEDVVMSLKLSISPVENPSDRVLIDVGVGTKLGQADVWTKVNAEFCNDDELLQTILTQHTIVARLAETVIDGQTAIDKNDKAMADAVEERTKIIKSEYAEEFTDGDLYKTEVLQESTQLVKSGKMTDNGRKKAQEKLRGGT